MDWPLRKRLFYSELMATHRRQQHAEHPHDGDMDMDMDPNAYADMADLDGMAGAGAGAGAGAAGGVTPSDVDIPSPPSGAGAGAAGGEEVDGKRITRRSGTGAEEQPGQQQRFDMREIHPAVRKHGNVVRVQNDEPEPDETSDDAGDE